MLNFTDIPQIQENNLNNLVSELISLKYLMIYQMEAVRNGFNKHTTYLCIQFKKYKNGYITKDIYEQILFAFLTGLYFGKNICLAKMERNK